VLISINLAVVNLLPIPGLDGGRLFILLIESVIRRPISQRLSTALTLGGFAFGIRTCVLVSINDISRLVG
ncbi:MAG: site-2 protease family protein, partial [Patescibacteria group bacterium]